MDLRSLIRRDGSAPASDSDDAGTLLARIGALSRKRLRRARDGDLLELRHRAALRLIEEGGGAEPQRPAPAFELLPQRPGVPEVAAADLSAELLRAAVLRNGCLLVRGLIGPREAQRLRGGIDSAFAAREAVRASGQSAGRGYYAEFVPDPRFDLTTDRGMVSDAFNVWGADSPRVMRELLETFERAGLRAVIEEYLGERPAASVNKCTLRRLGAEAFSADTPSAWHQDGAFLGEVRAMNVWLSLSRCGDVAPGLDIVPRRLDHIVETGTDGAVWGWSVSHAMAQTTAGEVAIERPIFEPGDALLFDEMLLHATAGDAHMPATRYAVECWFFAPSAFPSAYPPLAA